ncbi:MAG: hypothetical protein FVQ83_01790 [Chloroflexi bacterium]|nr:hypothetical protein [Chloroflexota bacterium]
MEALQQAYIVPGAIVHFFCRHIRNPKNKFVVIVHIDVNDDLVLGFFINSEIYPKISSNPARMACQVELLVKPNYAFLANDSYLDCSEIQEQFGYAELVDHLAQNPNDYICQLEEEEVIDLLQAVHGAKTIMPYDKDLIFKSLGEG